MSLRLQGILLERGVEILYYTVHTVSSVRARSPDSTSEMSTLVTMESTKVKMLTITNINQTYLNSVAIEKKDSFCSVPGLSPHYGNLTIKSDQVIP